MNKKIDKYAGMADIFAEQEKDEKIRAFELAKEKIEAEIKSLEQSSISEYDNGRDEVETRNEINALKNELRNIESRIADAKTK